MRMHQTLHICQSCIATQKAKPPTSNELAALQEKLSSAGLDVSVKSVDCLNVCDAPAAVSLQALGKASYVFSDIDITTDAEDIISTCQQHLAADNGWIVDALACGRLRFCLVARLPSISAD